MNLQLGVQRRLETRHSDENNEKWSLWQWMPSTQQWERSRRHPDGSTQTQCGSFPPKDFTSAETKQSPYASVPHEVVATPNQLLISPSNLVSASPLSPGSAPLNTKISSLFVVPPTSRPKSGAIDLDRESLTTQENKGDENLLYTIIEKPERYFNVGRIFMTLWVEPYTSDSTTPTFLPNRDKILQEPRRFVVVREGLRAAVCCRFEIYPSGWRLEPGIPHQHYALAFLAGNPSPAENTAGLEEFPIRVENPSIKLEPAYLLNFSKIYTVEHGVKAVTIGRIDRKFLKKLKAEFVMAMGGSILADEARGNQNKNGSTLERHGMSSRTERDPTNLQRSFLVDQHNRAPLPLNSSTESRAGPLPRIISYRGGVSAYEVAPPIPSFHVEQEVSPCYPTTSVTSNDEKDLQHEEIRLDSQLHEVTSLATHTIEGDDLVQNIAMDPANETNYHFADAEEFTSVWKGNTFGQGLLSRLKDGMSGPRRSLGSLAFNDAFNFNTSESTGEAPAPSVGRQTHLTARNSSPYFYSSAPNSTLYDELLYSEEATENSNLNSSSNIEVYYKNSVNEVSQGFGNTILENPAREPRQSRSEISNSEALQRNNPRTEYDAHAPNPIIRQNPWFQLNNESYDEGEAGHKISSRNDTNVVHEEVNRGLPALQSADPPLEQVNRDFKGDVLPTKGLISEAVTLDPAFQVHHSKKFLVGKVFKILWSEPSSRESSISSKTKYGESVYSSIRRFIVASTGLGHSLCLPILTYRKQGTAKNGVITRHHTIIYTSSQPPNPLTNESKLVKTPIRVIPITRHDKLAPESRLNYAKVYTIEHNNKVCFIGNVAPESRQTLLNDYRELMR